MHGTTLYFDGGCIICYGSIRFFILEEAHADELFSAYRALKCNGREAEKAIYYRSY